ncbi:MAG: arginyltransferase [Pseudomonadota bacterium]
MTANLQNINLFLSEPHDCNYLEGEMSCSLFIDPALSPDKNTYSSLIEHGFRRSGNNLYRPHCKSCQQCISTRVKVKQFKYKSTQKRCLRKNKDLTINIKPAQFEQEHFALYTQYLNHRHINSGMDGATEQDYINFLSSSWSETEFVEFRLGTKLLALAVTDVIGNGLSAVYTYFSIEQQYQKRSLGVYAILWQIEECKRRGLQWLYLGYWIAGNKKMSYKNQYQPAECYLNSKWIKYENLIDTKIAKNKP